MASALWSAAAAMRSADAGFFAAEFSVFIAVEFDECFGGIQDFLFGKIAALIGIKGIDDGRLRWSGRPFAVVMVSATALFLLFWFQLVLAEGSVIVFVEFEKGLGGIANFAGRESVVSILVERLHDRGRRRSLRRALGPGVKESSPDESGNEADQFQRSYFHNDRD